jgi:hypothetical protein
MSHLFDITAEEVTSEAAARVQSIGKNFGLLGNILDRHEATISKRWLKKSNKIKRTIILEAWGTDMAGSHRPDFQAAKLLKERHISGDTKYRDAFMVPYINQEDLSTPRSLLLFMSTRGRFHPSLFAVSDHEACRLGSLSNVFQYKMLLNHRFDLTDREGGTRYGRLFDHRAEPEIYASLSRHRSAEAACGLIVLEISDRVLDFLVKCAKLLLHDYPDEASLLQCPVQPLDIQPSTKLHAFASLATMAAEAPYQQPARLDTSRIASLLAARRDNAADHLWSLREDPGYFEAHVMDCREHCSESIEGYWKARYGRDPKKNTNKYWGKIISDTVRCSYSYFEIYSELSVQAEGLCEMQNSYADAIESQSDLPEPYAAAILNFERYLSAACKFASAALHKSFTTSPLMRESFDWEVVFPGPYEEDPDKSDDYMHYHARFELSPIKQEMLFILDRLRMDDEMGRDLGVDKLVDELQRLVDSEPSAEPLITPHVAGHVGDVAIASECLRQLEIYSPWAQAREKMIAEQQKSSDDEGYDED